MFGDADGKCSHFNSGYCRYAERQKGCKYIHTSEVCDVVHCKQSTCPKRHPKLCRFKDQCRFQSRCSYSHKQINFNEKESIKISKEIESLKGEVDKLKPENTEKITMLAKVHFKDGIS